MLVGESSFNRTPERIRTVAVAWTTTGAGPLDWGVEAATAAAASQSIMRRVTQSVHNRKHGFNYCANVDQFPGLPAGIAPPEPLCYGPRLASAGAIAGRTIHDVRSWRNW